MCFHGKVASSNNVGPIGDGCLVEIDEFGVQGLIQQRFGVAKLVREVHRRVRDTSFAEPIDCTSIKHQEQLFRLVLNLLFGFLLVNRRDLELLSWSALVSERWAPSGLDASLLSQTTVLELERLQLGAVLAH